MLGIGLELSRPKTAPAAAVAASLDLNFLTGSLPSGVTFTRAGTARAFNSSGVLTAYAADALRFEYDPATLVLRGLLLEPAATNLILQSQTLDNASWTKNRSSVTANAATAPDGTLTAEKLIEDATAANTHDVTQAATVASATTVTASIFAKAAERSAFALRCADSAFIGRAFFDLAAGTLGTKDAAVASSAIQNCGNGWYRCSATFVTGAAGTSANVQVQMSNGSVSYTGDGASGLYLWGAQLEAGSATSYIPTTTAAVARAADVAKLSSLSPWFDAAKGTFLIDAALLGSVVSKFLMACSDNTANELISLQTSSGGVVRISVTDGGVSQATPVCGYTTVAGTAFRAACAYAVNDFAVAAGGNATVGADASGTLPTPDRLYLGSSGTGAQASAIHVRRVRFYPVRKSNGQLIVLTTADAAPAFAGTLSLDFQAGTYLAALIGSTATTRTLAQLVNNPVTPTASGMLIGSSDNVTISFSPTVLGGAWFSNTQGTFFAHANIAYVNASFPRIFELSDGSDANRLIARYNTTSDIGAAVTIASSDTELLFTPYSQTVKIAISYGPAGIRACVNGGAVQSTASVVPALTGLQLGNRNTSLNRQLDGNLRSFYYHPREFTNAELIAATT